MTKKKEKEKKGFEIPKQDQVWMVVVIILVLVGGYGWYQVDSYKDERLVLEGTIEGLRQSLTEIEGQLANANNNVRDLSLELEDERDRFDSAKNIFDEITDTVGDLEKLSELDPELLQKYSKVFFLNEHYQPPRLRKIDEDYLYREGDTHEFHIDAWSFLDDLLEEAHDDGIELFVLSAYRSFGEQASLKSGYLVNYGSGANQFSADQGYSEHQLGTTVDFMTTGIDGTLEGFQNTEAYNWLLKNGHKYGFTLSYPEGNSYYIFEPWHWRFVGEELAGDLYRDKTGFYDMPQREIDEYLISIFD